MVTNASWLMGAPRLSGCYLLRYAFDSAATGQMAQMALPVELDDSYSMDEKEVALLLSLMIQTWEISPDRAPGGPYIPVTYNMELEISGAPPSGPPPYPYDPTHWPCWSSWNPCH